MADSWRTVADIALGEWAPESRNRVMQVAVAGRWEEARHLPLPADADAARGLVAPVAVDASADVAVEVEWLGHPLVFVGARRMPSGDASFVGDVARTVGADPHDPKQALAGLAGGEPTGLAEIELGAANAWHSVGPLRLWDPPPAGMCRHQRSLTSVVSTSSTALRRRRCSRPRWARSWISSTAGARAACVARPVSVISI